MSCSATAAVWFASGLAAPVREPREPAHRRPHREPSGLARRACRALCLAFVCAR